MNPYVFKTTCNICGGKGMATLNGIYSGVHINPDICRQVLQKKAEQLKKREKELNES